MKEINLQDMKMVHSGDEWTHPKMPCAKEMAPVLEHNEKIVSWLQPVSFCW